MHVEKHMLFDPLALDVILRQTRLVYVMIQSSHV